MSDHGRNVVIDGVVHDAWRRCGKTECGMRFIVWLAETFNSQSMAIETKADVDCMACIAAGSAQ